MCCVFIFVYATATTPTPAPAAAAAEHMQNAPSGGDAEMADEWTPVTNKKGKGRRQPKQ